MIEKRGARPKRGTGGLEPLPPQKKWRAIVIATLVLVPSYWSILAGLVAGATDSEAAGPSPAAALALGLVLVPFVFIALAFLSEHPRAPGAVLKAMGLSILVGMIVSALTVDGVTGIVAGVGTGGIVALRADEPHNWRARAIAVALAVIYTFILVRILGSAALLPAPIFPFTGIGIADHLSERRWEREKNKA